MAGMRAQFSANITRPMETPPFSTSPDNIRITGFFPTTFTGTKHPCLDVMMYGTITVPVRDSRGVCWGLADISFSQRLGVVFQRSLLAGLSEPVGSDGLPPIEGPCEVSQNRDGSLNIKVPEGYGLVIDYRWIEDTKFGSPMNVRPFMTATSGDTFTYEASELRVNLDEVQRLPRPYVAVQIKVNGRSIHTGEPFGKGLFPSLSHGVSGDSKKSGANFDLVGTTWPYGRKAGAHVFTKTTEGYQETGSTKQFVAVAADPAREGSSPSQNTIELKFTAVSAKALPTPIITGPSPAELEAIKKTYLERIGGIMYGRPAGAGYYSSGQNKELEAVNADIAKHEKAVATEKAKSTPNLKELERQEHFLRMAQDERVSILESLSLNDPVEEEGVAFRGAFSGRSLSATVSQPPPPADERRAAAPERLATLAYGAEVSFASLTDEDLKPSNFPLGRFAHEASATITANLMLRDPEPEPMAGGGSGAAAEGGASGGAGLGSTPAVASVGRNKKMCAPVVAYFRGNLDDYRYNLMVKELAQAEADIIETYRNKAAKAQSREERQSAENLLFAFQKERERVIALVGTPEEFEEIRKPRAPLVSYFPGHFVDCSYLSTVKSLAQAEADIAKYTERVAKAPMSSEERSMAEHLLRVSQDEKDSLLALVDTPEGLEEIKKPCAPSRWYYSGHFIRLDDDSMVKELAQAEADIAKYAEEVAKAPISSAERSMAEHLLRVSQDERERVILLLNRLGDPETEPLAEEPSGVGPGPVAEGGASGGAGSASTAGVSGFLSAKATFVLEFLRLYRLESQYFLFGSLFCNTRFLQELLQLPSPDAQFEKIKSHSDLKGTSRTATVVKKMLSQDRFHDLKSEFLPD